MTLVHTIFRTMLPAALAICLPVAALSAPAIDMQPQLHLPRTELAIGGHKIQVQLAQTLGEKQTGLMYRTRMPQDEGMLFVFEETGTQCFWMRNTLLPLTAAFVADDGTIVNLADMQPQSDAQHCSSRPVRYVLEMHQGWFSRHGIRPGMRVRRAGGLPQGS